MQTTTTKRTYRRESEWRALVEKFEVSNLTAKEFCAQHGIAMSGLYTWRKKFQATHDENTDSFIALTSLDESPEDCGASAWDVELELGPGTVLRIRKVQ